jgi:hypothetical protein
MTFAQDRVLQDRLVADLDRKRGTLLLSTVSFGEFAAPADPRHCREAEDFIDRIMPRVFLTDLRPDETIRQEEGQRDNRVRFPPSSDEPQLRLLVRRCVEENRDLSMRDFIGLARVHARQIALHIAYWNERFRGAFDEARQDNAYRRRAREVVPNVQRPRSLVICGELLRGFAIDQRAPLTDNNIVDFMHAFMSVNCCDFVLLDAAWANRVEEMRRRIAANDPAMEIARCYSRRNHGLERFLNDLEVFQAAAVA